MLSWLTAGNQYSGSAETSAHIFVLCSMMGSQEEEPLCVSLQDVHQAAQTIAPYAKLTPVSVTVAE
jgi:hypothetical protein